MESKNTYTKEEVFRMLDDELKFLLDLTAANNKCVTLRDVRDAEKNLPHSIASLVNSVPLDLRERLYHTWGLVYPKLTK